MKGECQRRLVLFGGPVVHPRLLHRASERGSDHLTQESMKGEWKRRLVLLGDLKVHAGLLHRASERGVTI